MRTTLRLVTAALAGATLIATAGAAAAEPATTPPAAAATASTGSSAMDFGSAALNSGSSALERGDLIYAIVFLVNLPFVVLGGVVCDLSSLSGDNGCVGHQDPVE